jgi:putative DNA primase/helicase
VSVATIEQRAAEVKRRAVGQWHSILVAAGIPAELLKPVEGPCPKCSGNTRFRLWEHFHQTGGVRCSHCHNSKNGDGIAAIQWWFGCSCAEAIAWLENYLGISPANGKATNYTPALAKQQPAQQSTTPAARDPFKHVVELPWSDVQAALFCQHKPGVTVAGLLACDASIIRYRRQWPAMGLPIIGQDGEKVGWALWPLNGKTLPTYFKDPQTGEVKTDYVRSLITAGSGNGWIGQADKLAAATHVWKVEGLSDVAALVGFGLPPGHIAITNKSGCGQDPAKSPWMLEQLAGKIVYVLHDCDKPGQEGATQVPRRDGGFRPGWAPAIAAHAAECKNVVLPYPIADTHGPDLRDWINAGGTVDQLLKLAGHSIAAVGQATEPDIYEADDDPHRLARENIAEYDTKQGRAIVFWHDEWWQWKRGSYHPLPVSDLRAKLARFIKGKFDERYRERVRRPAEDEQQPKPVKKVTQQLVSNVMLAMQGEVVLPSRIEMPSWLDDESRGRTFVSFKNGILDFEKFSNGANDCLLPHTPDWFSRTQLPYNFDPEALCPTWMRFLHQVWGGDEDAIRVLQMLFGYILTPDTSQQKIFLFVGPKRSGKGTIAHIMQQLLGKENYASPTLNSFSSNFGLWPLMGKMLAVVGDARLSNRVDQGPIVECLLRISGEDTVTVDRKRMAPETVKLPTRLVILSNELPRLNDPSGALASRFIVFRMHKSFYGQEDRTLRRKLEAELPGILIWAVTGWHELQMAGAIPQPECGVDLAKDLLDLSSPISTFVDDECIVAANARVKINDLFATWKRWCNDNGMENSVGSKSTFAQKLCAAVPSVVKYRPPYGNDDRRREYLGIGILENGKIEIEKNQNHDFENPREFHF